VVVAVAVVRMMQMPSDQVIRVTRVRYRFVPTVRAVRMLLVVLSAGMPGRARRRIPHAAAELVAVYVFAVYVVHVAFVQIIHVILVPDGGMAAGGSMRMAVCFMGLASHSRFSSPNKGLLMMRPLCAGFL
jgi:hypothetical protein